VTGTPLAPRDAGPAAALAARLARAYPNLPPYAAARLAEAFVRVGKAQATHAVRLCNGPPDGTKGPHGYAKWVAGGWQHDPAAGEAVAVRIRKRLSGVLHWLCVWAEVESGPGVTLDGDPRGHVMHIKLPGDREPVGVV